MSSCRLNTPRLQHAWQVVLVTSHSVNADDATSRDASAMESTWAGSFTLRATFVLTSSSLSISLSAKNGSLSLSQSPTLSSLHSSWTEGRKTGSGPGEQQQAASPLVVAPSICAHLSVATLGGVRLLGLRDSRFVDFEPARGDGRAASWGGWVGGLLSSAFQPQATTEPSTAPQGLAAADVGAGVGPTVGSSSSSSSPRASVESSQASPEQTETSSGVEAEGASSALSLDARKQQVAGSWWFDERAGLNGRLVLEKADYAEVSTPLRRMAWNDVRTVTVLDRVSEMMMK